MIVVQSFYMKFKSNTHHLISTTSFITNFEHSMNEEGPYVNENSTKFISNLLM